MNAKEEFLLFVNDKRIKSTIKCAYISYYTDGNYINKKTILLKVNYTEKQFQDFLEKLDFEYDNYDNYDTTNHITGIIWFRDGSWGEREFSEGKEWWEFKRTPVIPFDLI